MKNLKSFYSELGKGEKTKFCVEVADALDMSIESVMRWCKGHGKTKDEKAIKVLSEFTGIPVENVFAR